jgi:hypothetical protein
MMYSLSMGKRYERKPIQGNKGATGSLSSRAFSSPGALWKAGYQQHRDRFQESKSIGGGTDAGVCRFAREALQRTQGFIAGNFKPAGWSSEQGKEMSSGRKPNPLYVVPVDIPVIFHPLPESAADFLKRKEELQELIARMILLGRKKGRPSTKEESYEEAA